MKDKTEKREMEKKEQEVAGGKFLLQGAAFRTDNTGNTPKERGGRGVGEGKSKGREGSGRG